jgi:molecular chaperone HscB
MVAPTPSLAAQGLQADDFALFGLPRRFALDGAELEARWKALQAQAHPDRFAAQGAAAQRVAMQWSVRINEAYQRLKSPLNRGAYLCELAGQAVRAEDNTAMPAAFLMQQMAWREALDEATGDEDALDQLLQETRQARGEYLAQMAKALDDRQSPADAVACVRALMFIEKFERSVAQQLDALDD